MARDFVYKEKVDIAKMIEDLSIKNNHDKSSINGIQEALLDKNDIEEQKITDLEKQKMKFANAKHEIASEILSFDDKNQLQESNFDGEVRQNNQMTKEKSSREIKENDSTQNAADNSERMTVVLWIQKYKKEIMRISNFYINKKKDLNKDYKSLKEKIKLKKDADEKNKQQHKNVKRAISMNTVLKENKEFDEVGFAVSWKRACSNIFTQISWLHGFQNINIIAAERLLLKFKDMFKIDHKLENLFLDMNNTPHSCVDSIYTDLLSYTKKMFKTPTLVLEDVKDDKEEVKHHDNESDTKEFTDCNKEILNLKADDAAMDVEVLKLRQKVNKFYADNFNNGNQVQAKKELENRMSGYRIYDLKLIALHLGIILSSLLIFAMISLIPCNFSTINLISTNRIQGQHNI